MVTSGTVVVAIYFSLALELLNYIRGGKRRQQLQSQAAIAAKLDLPTILDAIPSLSGRRMLDSEADQGLDKNFLRQGLPGGSIIISVKALREFQMR